MSNETRVMPRIRKSLAVVETRKRGLAGKSVAKEVAPAKRRPVLLAVAGNEASTSFVDVAGLAAARLSTSLRVISVVEPVLQYGLPYEHSTEVAALDRNALDIRAQQLERVLSQRGVAGAKATPDVRMGRVATEVTDAAKAARASLIVVGASPQRRLRHIVSGRRAAQILHRADTPVLSVVPWLHSLPKNIIAAVDFGPASLFAAELAAELLATGGTLILVHVVPLNLLFPGTNPLSEKLRRDALRELEVIAERIGERVPTGSTVECHVLEGDPLHELLDLAANNGADLIALGTRSGSTFRRVFVGSLATDVFQTSLVSVLAAPPPSAADQVALALELSGTVVATKHEDFPQVLREFSNAYAGKSATIEEDDPLLGAQEQVHGYALREVAYDIASRTVEVMLGSESDNVAHLTRTIPKAKSLAVARLAGRGAALRIEHGTAVTLVLVSDAK